MYNPDIHHRRSIRLPGYDYTVGGAYFVTVCTQERSPLLGRISDGEMRENEAGRMVRVAWEQLPERCPSVELDAFIVMPNHIHGILLLEPPSGDGPKLSLPDVVQRLKSWTTAQYRQGVHQRGWPPFPGSLWQRNYHERIIRGNVNGWRYVTTSHSTLSAGMRTKTTLLRNQSQMCRHHLGKSK